VTIVGPGGIGKTRLSLEAAAAEGFADGVFFVPLAPLADAQHIVAAISDSIWFRYLARGDPRQGLLEYLRQKRLLLVMDNFEHLLASADMVSDILLQTAQVKVLITSRERLNLSGEAVYMLSGLDYPADPGMSGEEMKQFGAVRLLLDRARLVRPGLEVDGPELDQVARICRLVQGMPLALVLAAGWLELLTFEEVAGEIATSLDILEGQARDMPERQRSVRATFDYSWQRLAPDDQQVFSRLAVFRGGFSRRAAQQVAYAGLLSLRTLIEKSLIMAGGPDRYGMHELLRQFAEEKLEETSQAGTTRDAHSRYYLEGVAYLEADLKGRRQIGALEEIEADLDNVRAAWDWALDRSNEQIIDQTMESLSLFFYMRSRNQEGWILFQQAIKGLGLDQSASDQEQKLWGRLTARSEFLKSQFTRSDKEIPQAIKKSLAIAEANTDQSEIAYSYLALGHYHSRVANDFRQALNDFEQSLERYQSLADRYYMAHLLHRVGYSSSIISGTEVYMRYTRQSLELARQIGDLSDAATAVGNLGWGSLWTGDYAGAEFSFLEALRLSQQMGRRDIHSHSLIALGCCHFLNGRLEEAQETAAEGAKIAKDIMNFVTEAYGLAILSMRSSLDSDYKLGQHLASESLDKLTNLTGDLLGHWAQATACVGLGQTEQAGKQVQSALKIGFRWRWYGTMTWVLPVVGIILGQAGQPKRAAEILGLYFNHPLRPSGWAEKWPLLREWMTRLEESLGADGYQAAWERGMNLDLMTAVEALLAEG
jgi:predicted ATPase